MLARSLGWPTTDHPNGIWRDHAAGAHTPQVVGEGNRGFPDRVATCVAICFLVKSITKIRATGVYSGRAWGGAIVGAGWRLPLDAQVS